MSGEAKTAEVVGENCLPSERADNRLEKVIQEFMGGHYDQSRIIERGQEGFEEGLRGFFKGGLALLILERHESVHALGQILDQYFPTICRRTAYNYMRYARTLIEQPAFRAFASERGGYTKMMTILEICSQEEVVELAETGEVHEINLDKIDKMSTRQLKRALRQAKDKADQAVKKATENLSKELAEAKEENDSLKAALNNNDVEAAQKLLSKAGSKIIEAANLLRRIPREHLAADGLLRQSAYAVLAHAKGIAEDVEMEIAVLAGDPGEQVRNYMGRLRAQHGGVDGAPAADVANS